MVIEAAIRFCGRRRRAPNTRRASCALLVAVLASCGGTELSLSQTPGPASTARCAGLPESSVNTSAPPSDGTPFPLTVAPDRGVILDSGGEPMFLQGDAAWSLIAQLGRGDVITYLDGRRAAGFNTILVNLIEHKFASQAPANIYGDQPFTSAGDFSSPEDDYFSYADWVITQAEDRGFVVLLTPAYIGYAGTDEGWWADMERAGP